MKTANTSPELESRTVTSLTFNAPRSKDDLDLLGVVYSLIKHLYSNNAATYFISQPMIVDVMGLGSKQQRMIINKFLTELLLIWRNSPISSPVDDALIFLSNDGSNSNWVYNFNSYVLPFLKINKILGE